MSGMSSNSGQFWRADPPVESPANSGRSPAKPGETGAEKSLPAEHLIEQLQQAAQILKNRLTEHYQQFDLNEIRFTVLKIVNRAAPHGCSQTDLADGLGQSESSISTLVERMRTDSLIYRLRSKLDRRKRVLILTERGQAILQRVEQCHAARLEQILKTFSPSRRRELSVLLGELISHLQPQTEKSPGENRSAIPSPHLRNPNTVSGAKITTQGPEAQEL